MLNDLSTDCLNLYFGYQVKFTALPNLYFKVVLMAVFITVFIILSVLKLGK